jgi:ribosomal protein S9
LKEQKKGHVMTAVNIWEKGMIARRGVSNTMPSYSKILKFKVMKPLVHAGEKASLGDFDVELEVDSGGSDDSKLNSTAYST